jgi:PBP1b-binding outer membrane lipoprotein LpoB
MIKKILIISSLVIALILTGCSPSGVLQTVPPLSLAATSTSLNNQTADIDNIQEESLNGQDDSQEVKVEEADGEIEANEPANEQDQEDNLSNGGHQDQDNIDVDHQFEGVE